MTKPRKEKPPFDTDMTQQTDEEPVRVNPGDRELDEVFSEFPQNEACIELSRTTEKGGKPGFLEDIMPSEFSFGEIARQYGGGNYVAKGKYKDGTSIKRSFFIEGEPFPMKRKVPASLMLQPTAPAPVAQALEVPRGPDGNPDMGALIAAMMNMMKGMIQESKGNKAEWLAELKTMREIFGVENKQTTPIAEQISILKTGIELAQSAGGEGGGGGFPWLLALDKLQGPLTELVSTIKVAVTQGRTAPGPVILPNSIAPQPGQPTGQPANAEPPKSEGEHMEMILKGALSQMLPILVTGASQKAEPGFYADLLLDQIPRQFYATAKTFLEKADCINQLAQINPAVSKDQDTLLWFESLRKELTDALSQELGGNATGTIQPQPSSESATGSSADL